jgi:hypothetical protein
MKKEHWVILGVGAVALYIYMNKKKKTPVAAVTAAATKELPIEEELSATGRAFRRRGVGVVKAPSGQPCTKACRGGNCAQMCQNYGGTYNEGGGMYGSCTYPAGHHFCSGGRR